MLEEGKIDIMPDMAHMPEREKKDFFFRKKPSSQAGLFCINIKLPI
jgi:hypothetical protein